jgi:hypothetical protein
MDRVFWLSIAFGGALGFVVSIVANLATPTFGDYFSRSKMGWIERNKKSAFKKFNAIQSFRRGAEDKYMYFVAQWGFILMFGIMDVFLETIPKDHLWQVVFFVVVQCYIAIQIAWLLVTLNLWYWRMNNFAEYKASLLKKWPDLDLGTHASP